MEKNGDEVKPDELLTLHFFSFIEIHANQLDSGTYFEESWEREIKGWWTLKVKKFMVFNSA